MTPRRTSFVLFGDTAGGDDGLTAFQGIVPSSEVVSDLTPLLGGPAWLLEASSDELAPERLRAAGVDPGRLVLAEAPLEALTSDGPAFEEVPPCAPK